MYVSLAIAKNARAQLLNRKKSSMHAISILLSNVHILANHVI